MQFIQKILLLIVSLCSGMLPQDINRLKSRIDDLITNNIFLDKTILACEVYDLTSSAALYSINSKLLLHPASNMKLLTSAAGVLFLNDYSYQTSILYTGEIVNGILLGDLYLRGGCDPKFTTADLDSLIFPLKQAGISGIAGNVYADISFKDDKIWGKGWMWDDDPSEDAPYLAAFNINNNTVRVIIEPDSIIARTDPSTSYFVVDNKAVKINNPGEKETLAANRDWLNRTNEIRITGTIDPYDTTQRVEVLNVFDPVSYFLTLFRERMEAHLITLNGKIEIKTAPGFVREIYTLKRPLDSLLNDINKQSNNLTAEMVLYALAEKYYGKPASAQNGLLMIDSLIRLTGLNPLDYRLADGSGVSHYNLVSAELLISVLKYLYYRQPELYQKIYKSLAIGGKDGTLSSRMIGTSAEGKVHAKTGTLTGISCLSGYVDSATGNTIAVSILVQNFPGGAGYARYIQDELCRIITEY